MDGLVTLHLGSRLPKRYYNEAELARMGRQLDPAAPELHADQPGAVKCRVKIRISKDSTLSQALDEIRRCWTTLDHGAAPAWVSGTNDFAVKAVAAEFGGVPIRDWEPAEGDE